MRGGRCSFSQGSFFILCVGRYFFFSISFLFFSPVYFIFSVLCFFFGRVAFLSLPPSLSLNSRLNEGHGVPLVPRSVSCRWHFVPFVLCYVILQCYNVTIGVGGGLVMSGLFRFDLNLNLWPLSASPRNCSLVVYAVGGRLLPPCRPCHVTSRHVEACHAIGRLGVGDGLGRLSTSTRNVWYRYADQQACCFPSSLSNT